MAEYLWKKQAAEFLIVLDLTEKWLDQHFSQPGLPPKVEDLANGLRRYVAHCRKRMWRKNLSLEEIQERRRKIDNAYFNLWRAVR